jgi:hypothetical protein
MGRHSGRSTDLFEDEDDDVYEHDFVSFPALPALTALQNGLSIFDE